MINDDKSSIPMRDRELLIPVGGGPDITGDGDSKASSSGSAAGHHRHNSGREVSVRTLLIARIGLLRDDFLSLN